MNTRSLILLILLLSFTKSKSATCTATVSGDWSTASVWSCGHVPACGDVVIIPIGITVTITSNQVYTACSPTPAQSPQIYIHGCLKFDNGDKLRLPCGTNIYFSTTGSIVPGTGGGNSNNIEICNVVVWNAAAGTTVGTACYPPGCSTAPLPVELVAFTGFEEKKIVNLYWKTIMETNNHHFDVEKSFDAVTFEKIGEVRSKAPEGSSKGALEYTFTDNDLKHPLYYYRLKQVDNNSDWKRTSSISVRIYAAEINIYPNPNSGVFSIEVPSVNIGGELSIKICNAVGQVVLESIETVKNDQITGAKVNITPSKPLAKGVYHSTIKFEGELYQLKLIVQ